MNLFNQMQTSSSAKFKDISRNLWISPEKSFVYLSVPKCGCSSVKYFIRSLYQDSSSINNLHDISESPFISGLELDYHELKVVIDKAFCFTILREPRGRILSAFLDKFKLMHLPNLHAFVPQLTGSILKNDQEYIDFAASLTFYEFLLLVGKSPSPNEHWAPYSLAVNALSSISENLEIFDLSNIKVPLYYLHKNFRVSSDKLPKNYFCINKNFGHSTRASARLEEFYTSEVSSIFENIYHEDISLWATLQS